jgi:RING-type zinc-finger/B-box zinc finger
MENFSYAEENYLFTCPACYQQISDSQIHDHIQNCEFYSPHNSRTESYSSIHSSDEVNSYQYHSSSSSSQSAEHESDDGSSRHKQMTPSKTQSIAICPVCFYNFHNTRHAPLLLPNCGHTVCKPCLKDIRDKSDKFCCPICRAGTRIDIKSLPINYALLELTEKKNNTRCLKHDLEYVAYCNDDDAVLCGACVFDHKTHMCCLLTDLQLDQISDQKKASLKKEAEDLVLCRKNWYESMQKMEEHIHKINECVEIHKSGIINMEKKMIKSIQEGSKSCIQELANLATHESLKKLQSSFQNSLNFIDNEINKLKSKYEKFEELSMAEKLENTSGVKEEIKEVPSVTPALAILEKLKVYVDYKQAIQNQKVF